MKKIDFKNIPSTLWLLPVGFFAMLLAVLLTQLDKLYDIEQTRVLVYYSDLIIKQIAPAGGVADFMALWMQQFFRFPMAGAAFMAALLTLIAWMTGSILGRMGYKGTAWQILAWLPSTILYVYTENRIFFCTGHTAMLLSVFGLWLYDIIAGKSRLAARIAVLVLIPLIGWAASTCVWAMVAGMLVLSLLRYKDYIAALECLLASAATVALAMHFCLAVNSMELFSPDIYNFRTKTETVMTLVWVATVLVLALPLMLRKFAMRINASKYVAPVCSLVIILASGIHLYGKNHDEQSGQRLAILRMLANGDYNGVANFCDDYMKFYYTSNYFAMVVSMNGNLPDFVGSYITRPQQLVMDSSEDVIVRQLMTEVYYHIGYVAGAHYEAFEWNEPTEGMMRPEALQILAKTNIIQGHYAVAEKYLDHLEHTLFYKDWAEKYKKFLYNDKAVEADSELGPRRKAVDIKNGPNHWTTIPLIVRNIAKISPTLPAKQYYESYKKLGIYDSYQYKD